MVWEWVHTLREGEDRSALPGIPGGLGNTLGGGAVARVEYRPRWWNLLELVGRTQGEVDNMDMASTPPVGGTVGE